jgi:hypothetical protein
MRRAIFWPNLIQQVLTRRAVECRDSGGINHRIFYFHKKFSWKTTGWRFESQTFRAESR